MRFPLCQSLLLASCAYAQDYSFTPAKYPSPSAQGLLWEAAFARADAFVSNLTLEEKAILTTGAPGPCIGNIAPIYRLGFNGLCLQDGPLAIRQATYASVFPAGLTAAASWDRNLIYLRGLYMGAEFRGKGSHVFLGPVVGPLGRSGYAGRNWEGFSPDPYLSGVGAEETIRGIQQNGVQATIKHLVGNEQETQRQLTDINGTTIEAVSSNIDDRTMHELYMWPFGNSVRAGVASVMCSYNRLNSSYACQNSDILNGQLKTELGFQGYVMSDWLATHAGVASINAGLDMEMPGSLGWSNFDDAYFGQNLTAAVQNGTVEEDRVDDMIRRIMTPYYYLGQDQGFPPIDGRSEELNILLYPNNINYTLGPSDVDVRGNHSQLIRELAAAGTVLLKNVNNTLPLRAPRSVGIFGNDAGDVTDGNYYSGAAFGQYGFEQGTLSTGGGSGTGRFSYLISPLEAIKQRALQDGSLVQYILNNDVITNVPPVFKALNLTFNSGIGTITPIPEVCIVFLKTWAGEGADRTSLLADWNSTAVVETVASYCNNTIVVSHSTGLNIMPWADNPNVTAILAAHLPGEQNGNSLVDVLYGAVNPSGKLPYTIALNESDYAFASITNSTELLESLDPNAWQSYFTEGLLIDYRHFDYYNESVAFEFGFGLSYTTFEMADIVITPVSSNVTARPTSNVTQPGGKPELWDVLYTVTATVQNSGTVAGATIPQLYLSLPQTDDLVPTPVNVLRGFDKVQLEPGASAQVSFNLMRRDLSYWDRSEQEWLIPAGPIGVNVGLSSRDLRLTGELTVLV